MENTTSITNGKNGWQAETVLSFNEAKFQKLTISTCKSNGALTTRASVSEHRDGMMRHAFGLGTGKGDYSKRVVVTQERATEKNVRAQHANALHHVPAIVAEAHAHYAAQKPPAPPSEAELLMAAIQKCRRFISAPQIEVMVENCGGEEGDFFKAKFLEVAKLLDAMPSTGQSAGGDQAIVHLHYFSGSADFYITEKDIDHDGEGQVQAYGLADLYGDGGEVGYISILELIRGHVDFDLHWKPCTLGELREKREKRASVAA